MEIRKVIRKYLLCKILFLALFMVPNVAKPQQKLSVMSYNIHHGQDADNNNKLEAMAELIKLSDADIVGLQEVDSVCFRSGQTDQAKKLAELTGMQFAYVRHFAFDGGSYGMALLSKYPISNVRNRRLPVTSNSQEKTVAFLTAHVAVSSTQSWLVGVAHLDYRDANSRLRQANLIVDSYKKNPHPGILVGDMNAEPGTGEMSVLLDYFRDTQPDGFYTFPAVKPTKKIDYVLIDNFQKIKIVKKEVFTVPHSDHLPVLSTIVLK
ncbi:MAG: endonuclease/exonuclease/phosphatase family protein [Bacteroidales bacterium]